LTHTSCTKINSKSIRNLNVIPKATKLLDADVKEIFQDINIGNGVLDVNPKAKGKGAK
jgi:hypothetical protein